MKIVSYREEVHDEKFTDENSRMGYVRGDIDKDGRLWTSFISLKKEAGYSNYRNYLNDFMSWFVEQPFILSVDAMRKFCKENADSIFGDHSDQRYRFFAEDELNSYLIFLICRENDYNFYVNAYQKEV